MKKVKILKLRIKNFLSIGDKPVELVFDKFSKGKINIITGENLDVKDSKNGVGKSSLIEAMGFVLYGKSFRDVKLDKLINNVTNKPTEGEIIFSINDEEDHYRLIRRLKPSKVHLYKGDKDITLDTIANNSSYIEDLIGYSLEGFSYYKLMSMTNNVPFMALKPANKRRIVEDLLDSRSITNGSKLVNEEIAKNKRDQISLFSSYNELTIRYSKNAEQIENIKDNIKNFAKKVQENQKNDSKTLKEYKDKLNKIKESKNDDKADRLAAALIKINEKIEYLHEEYSKGRISLSTVETNVNNYNKGICPTCKRPLSNDDNHITIDDYNKMVKKLTVNKESIQNIKAELEKEKNNKNKIEEAIHKIEINKEKLNSLIETLVSSINNIENKKYDEYGIDSMKNILESALADNNIVKTDVDNKKILLDNVNKELSILDKCKFILGDDGIKTVMIDRIIQLYNALVNSYLVKFESPHSIIFNSYFEESITNQLGKEVDYFTLSGAEKKYIDIAIILAFSDLKSIQQGIDLNVLFFDELLDSSVDSNGIDKIVNVLKERDENIFIVSHRKECKMLADDTGGQCVFLVKEGGITFRSII